MYSFCLLSVQCRNSSVSNNYGGCSSLVERSLPMWCVLGTTPSISNHIVFFLILYFRKGFLKNGFKQVWYLRWSTVVGRSLHLWRITSSIPIVFNHICFFYLVCKKGFLKTNFKRRYYWCAAMAMNGHSAFPKAPALLESHHQIV